MLNTGVKIAFLILIPLSAFALPKEKGTTTLQVVTSRTKIHGTSSGTIFTYTNLMFTEVNGKRVVYECAQRGDVCPVLESGKSYTADQEGSFIYISTTSPEDRAKWGPVTLYDRHKAQGDVAARARMPITLPHFQSETNSREHGTRHLT